jgi:type VI secretion system ImpJ/VasE family protein
MRNNKPLYWGLGQFLLPQHLQQQDLFHHYQRLGCLRVARPFGWGIEECVLHRDGLGANYCQVLSLRLVTRDGALIEAGSEVATANARISPRDLGGLLDPALAEPLSVYLALPRYQTSGDNLIDRTPDESEHPPRFQLAKREVADLYASAAEPGEVAFMDYSLELLFDREDRFAHAGQTHELTKIAELRPSPAGTGAVLIDDYVPPCISIRGTPLNRWLQEARDLIAAKVQSEDFVVTKRQRANDAAGSRDLLHLVVLQTLNRYLPLLQHHLEAGVAHPFETYALLRQMIGELSTFSEDVTVFGGTQGREATGLPPYDHEDLRRCFQPAFRTVRRLIEDLVSGTGPVIRLDYDGEYFAAKVPEEFFAAGDRYYLMIDSSLRGEELVALLQQTGKIGSRDNMPQLRRAALFGLRIQRLPVPPRELPQRDERLSYFSIDTSSPHWGAIRSAGDIAVFGRLNPDETAIKLLAVRPDS